MTRSAALIAFLVLLALGGAAGSWHARQGPAVPHVPVEPPSTPLGAVGRPLDPAFVVAMKTETGPKKWLRLVAASEQATAAEFPALIKMAEGDYTAVRIIAGRWAEVDPRHMFKSLHALLLQPEDGAATGQYSTRHALIESLFDTWGRNDPAAVLKALNEVPDFSGRDSLRSQAVYQLSKSSPAYTLEAMAMWKVNYYPETKKLREWASQDPEAAALAVQKIGNQNISAEVLRVIGEAWAASDPQAALRHAETLPPNSRAALAGEAIAAWAKRDPQAAAAFALSRDSATYRASLGQAVARSMGATDPAGAVAWSTTNLHGRARDEAVVGVIQVAAQKDVAGALAIVDSMEEGPVQAGARQAVFQSWFSQKGQRDAAVEWLTSLPDEETRRNALTSVEWTWYRDDPAGAGKFLTGPNGYLASPNMVSNVARTWAVTTPDAALAQAARLPEAQATAARSSILNAWLSTRPDAALSMFAQMPPGQDRNNAIISVTQNFARQNPERAATFIRGLQGDEQKLAENMLRSVPEEQRAKVAAVLKRP